VCLLRGTGWNFTIHFTKPTPYIDRTVAQAASRRPLATLAHFLLQPVRLRFVVDKVALQQVFPPSRIPLSPVSIIPPLLLPGGKMAIPWSLHINSTISEIWAHWIEIFYFFVFRGLK
jgi:hypothetical protein